MGRGSPAMRKPRLERRRRQTEQILLTPNDKELGVGGGGPEPAAFSSGYLEGA